MQESVGIGRLSPRRYWFNNITRWVVALGGAGVIGAITLIFAYLLWVVAPIFTPGSIAANATVAVENREPVLVDVSENGDVYLRMSTDGTVEFYDSATHAPIAAYAMGIAVASAQRVYPTVDLYAIVDGEQQLWFMRAQYIVNFVDGNRTLSPKLEFPFRKRPIELESRDGQINTLDAHYADGALVIANTQADRLTLRRYSNVQEGFPLPSPQHVNIKAEINAQQILLGPRNQWVYLMGANGEVEVLGIRSLNAVKRFFRGSLLAEGEELTASGAILGRYSLLIADNHNRVRQWSMLQNDDGYRFESLRQFQLDEPVVRLIPEPRRKGFAALSTSGMLTLLYPTSGRTIAHAATTLPASAPLTIAPRSDELISAPTSSTVQSFELNNKHPELSLASLWAEIWYEGYDEPIFSWQSSSADNDFEPKFSLTPLAFGTFKAAFYALLFAVPIAIMGAVYTAYFMAPAMRAWVKPGIEIMAALPTVILGFIGGLWLAPIIEANLSSILSIFVFLPAGLIVFALLWPQLPDRISKPFNGWYGLLVLPLISAMVGLAFAYGPFMEGLLFGGDSKTWFREVLGLSYDQRNALVVGLVMGLAVIPTIFSIAEDAIYGVPTHLINGSLALGATSWQTLVRVVLLTASPGIFSAVMIGMGRAVGETMIVLMATGNTPLMDFNIFEGMRTFAANIAVELPESEVDSSHYRILFLAALVLFILTFIFNTFAEVVRQRLRARYGSL